MNLLKKFTVILSLAFTFQQLNAQVRDYESFSKTLSGIDINVTDGHYAINAMNDKILHVSFLPKNKQVKDFSFAVEMKPINQNIEVFETEENLRIISGAIELTVTKSPFHITYYHKDKKLIDEKSYSQTDTSWMFNFSISNDEIFYGGGARVLGMNRRGNRLHLYNRAHYGYETRSELMNYTLPLTVSSNGYALLFDNAGKGYLDLDSKKQNNLSYETFSGTPNYYIIVGDNWFDIINQYTLLTGRQPLPPRWAFGNFSSRFGYHSQKETESTVEKFHDEKIPLDAIVIDIYWFGKDIKGSMGNLDWYTDSFPSPQKMIDRFAKKGIKTILVTEPFILTTSKKWQEAVDNRVLGLNKTGQPYTYDFYFGNTGLIDLYNPEARQWFWNIYKQFINQGIAGWWGDLGEPEVHPGDMQHQIGKGDEIHNAYGHEWAKLIYEGYKKDFPDVRPFILMRAGYAGSQRYGMIPWSGDVNRSWGGLISQPEIALQMGMQGLAYMHSDLGGFAGGEQIDDELYLRWLQYGIFQPIFRPHAQEHIPAEPVYQNERTKILARQTIELRYKLLPYIYNLAFENHLTGKPLMTPLFFHDVSNKSLMIYDSAYMWGNEFLVSPVKSKGAMYQQVYMPAGKNWIDFHTGQRYLGGRYNKIVLAGNYIPVFVKEGSFIPMASEAVNTEKYSLDNFDLHFYASNKTSESSYTMYNDDGKTPEAYEKELYELYNFKALESNEYLKITLVKETPNNDYAKSKSNVKLMVHNLDSRPSSIIINGEKLKSKYISWNPVTYKLIFYVECSTKNTDVVINK